MATLLLHMHLFRSPYTLLLAHISHQKCPFGSPSVTNGISIYLFSLNSLPVCTTQNTDRPWNRNGHTNNASDKLTMFLALSSWPYHCENSPGSFDECQLLTERQVAAIPTLFYFYHPIEGGKPSQPNLSDYLIGCKY